MNININPNNNLKINPKFYPLIWVALIFAYFVNNFYGVFVAYEPNSSVWLAILYGLVDVVVSCGMSAFLIYLVASFLWTLGARKGLIAIPRQDFKYIIMIFVAFATLTNGIINTFSFIEPVIEFCVPFAVNIVTSTVAFALMFFLVFIPQYLKPRQASRYFNYYGKIYVILTVVLNVFASVMFLTFFDILEDPELLATFDSVYYTTATGESMTVAEFGQMLEYAIPGMKVSMYINLAVCALIIIAFVVLDKYLKNKAKDFKEENPSMDGVVFTDGKNFYTVDDLKKNGFGANGNPFAEDEPEDQEEKVFDEFDL